MIKHCKLMVNLKGYPLNSTLLGLVSDFMTPGASPWHKQWALWETTLGTLNSRVPRFFPWMVAPKMVHRSVFGCFFSYMYIYALHHVFFCELFEVTKLRFAICSWFVCTPFMVFDVPFRVLIFCMHCLLMVCFTHALKLRLFKGSSFGYGNPIAFTDLTSSANVRRRALPQILPPTGTGPERFAALPGWKLVVCDSAVLSSSFFTVHQKLRLGPNPNGPRSVSCNRAIRYSGCFGVRSVGPVGDFLYTDEKSKILHQKQQTPVTRWCFALENVETKKSWSHGLFAALEFCKLSLCNMWFLQVCSLWIIDEQGPVDPSYLPCIGIVLGIIVPSHLEIRYKDSDEPSVMRVLNVAHMLMAKPSFFCLGMICVATWC